MRLVVADTGPLNYLVWIGAVEILPKLFETVLVPQAVQDELLRAGAPEAVRHWAAHPPAWLDLRPNPKSVGLTPNLDDGERAAIALALNVGADLVLMDDREGVAAALALGVETIGTLGVLDRAARHGLIDLETAFAQLKATNFRVRPDIMGALLVQHKKRTK
jgi:predicted nucleic acid-binding protein